MIVYVIHFSKKLGHAQHYIGTTKMYRKRMTAHRAGRGASILKACNERGINWRVVLRYFGSRKLERKLKARKNTAGFCPVCCSKRRRVKERSARRKVMASERERKIIETTHCPNPKCKAQPGKPCTTTRGQHRGGVRGQVTSLHRARRELYAKAHRIPAATVARSTGGLDAARASAHAVEKNG